MKIFKFAVFCFILAWLLFWGTHVFDPTLVRGQVSKQTFVTHMAQGFERGDTIEIFPVRHFLEIQHPGPVPWAEEFPLYTAAMALLKKMTPFSLEISGKILSALALLGLLFSLWSIFKGNEKESKTWIGLGILMIAMMPAFFIYSTSVMPDLMMLCFCAWAMVFSLRNRSLLKWSVLGIAILFKYYAVFTGLGLLFFELQKALKERSPLRALKEALGFALCLAPALLYLGFVFHQSIPNPISEYRALSGVGHGAKLEQWLSVKFYLRAMSWIFNKNTTAIFGILMGVICFHQLWKKVKIFPEGWLVSMLLGQLVFIFAFSSSFFVHDYYALQINLVLSFSFLAYWRSKQVPKGWKKLSPLFLILSVYFLSSVDRIESATLPQNYYVRAASLLKENTESNEWGVLVLDSYAEATLHLADRTAWMVSVKKLHDFPQLPPLAEARLGSHDPVKWIAILLTEWTSREEQDQTLSWVLEKSKRKIVLRKVLESTNSKEPRATFILIR
jgi:hypothetical protein